METEGHYQCGGCGEPMNIIGVIEHASVGCEPVLQATDLTQSERSTLMYVESRVVDEQGKLDPRQMNHEDHQNLKLFGAAGILDVAEPEVHHADPRKDMMRVVKFTDEAWDLARDSRQMRAADWMDPETVGLDGDQDGN